MSNHQANLGGPGLLSPQDGTRKGSGTPVKVWQVPTGGFVRGSIVQGIKGAMSSIDGVDNNQFNGPTGVNMNVGIPTDSDDAVLGVITDEGPFLAGHEARVHVSGMVRVKLEVTNTTAYTEGQALYAIDGEDFLTANASRAGGVGRKCGMLLQAFTASANEEKVVLALFQGLPPYL